MNKHTEDCCDGKILEGTNKGIEILKKESSKSVRFGALENECRKKGTSSDGCDIKDDDHCPFSMPVNPWLKKTKK